jgi:hypothetical protein
MEQRLEITESGRDVGILVSSPILPVGKWVLAGGDLPGPPSKKHSWESEPVCPDPFPGSFPVNQIA